MSVERFCRAGLHPIDYRTTRRNGRTHCSGCYRERRVAVRQEGLGRLGVWSTPVVDADRLRRYEAWAAGLDAAIQAIRRTEGFDGQHVVWQTLGEILQPDPSPSVVPPAPAPPVLRVVPIHITPRGVLNRPVSTHMARFQAMAAVEIGRIAQ